MRAVTAADANSIVLERFRSLTPADFLTTLEKLRPPLLPPDLKARVLASLPTEGEIKRLNASDLLKLDAVAPILRAHGRDGAYILKVVDNPQAHVAIYARFVVLISYAALQVVNAGQLQAIVAHEIGHEYVMEEYEAARQKPPSGIGAILRRNCHGHPGSDRSQSLDTRRGSSQNVRFQPRQRTIGQQRLVSQPVRLRTVRCGDEEVARRDWEFRVTPVGRIRATLRLLAPNRWNLLWRLRFRDDAQLSGDSETQEICGCLSTASATMCVRPVGPPDAFCERAVFDARLLYRRTGGWLSCLTLHHLGCSLTYLSIAWRMASSKTNSLLAIATEIDGPSGFLNRASSAQVPARDPIPIVSARPAPFPMKSMVEVFR